MLFQRIKTPGVAHNAYLIGSKGIAVLIDPRRDVDEYLQIARKNRLQIKYVLETHRQEDFVFGSDQIREITRAEIVSGKHSYSAHSDIYLDDGETTSGWRFDISLPLYSGSYSRERILRLLYEGQT